jgi:hypothetical protein
VDRDRQEQTDMSLSDGHTSEVRPYDEQDARRDAAVEMFKRHARAARPESNYDADIEWLEYAIIAFADEWSGR